MKKWIAFVIIVTLTMGLAGCGAGTEDGNISAELEGTCEEILEKVYANADLDDDMRESMEFYQNTPIDENNMEYILGTTDVKYTDSIYSAPMMSSIAYQCVLLRIGEDQDVEAAKTLLEEKADPVKWICVGAESVVVENVGNVILYIMADEATANAVKASFLALRES